MGSEDSQTIPNWRNWFSDIQMIGKHFLLYSQALRDVKRHYTICNVMIPENRSELIQLTEQIIRGESIICNTKLFGDADQSCICVTVKNYKAAGGVSTQLFAATSDEDMPLTTLANEVLGTQMSDRGPMIPMDALDFSPVKSKNALDFS